MTTNAPEPSLAVEAVKQLMDEAFSRDRQILDVVRENTEARKSLTEAVREGNEELGKMLGAILSSQQSTEANRGREATAAEAMLALKQQQADEERAATVAATAAADAQIAGEKVLLARRVGVVGRWAAGLVAFGGVLWAVLQTIANALKTGSSP